MADTSWANSRFNDASTDAPDVLDGIADPETRAAAQRLHGALVTRTPPAAQSGAKEVALGSLRGMGYDENMPESKVYGSLLSGLADMPSPDNPYADPKHLLVQRGADALSAGLLAWAQAKNPQQYVEHTNQVIDTYNQAKVKYQEQARQMMGSVMGQAATNRVGMIGQQRQLVMNIVQNTQAQSGRSPALEEFPPMLQDAARSMGIKPSGGSPQPPAGGVPGLPPPNIAPSPQGPPQANSGAPSGVPGIAVGAAGAPQPQTPPGQMPPSAPAQMGNPAAAAARVTPPLPQQSGAPLQGLDPRNQPLNPTQLTQIMPGQFKNADGSLNAMGQLAIQEIGTFSKPAQLSYLQAQQRNAAMVMQDPKEFAKSKGDALETARKINEDVLKNDSGYQAASAAQKAEALANTKNTMEEVEAAKKGGDSAVGNSLPAIRELEKRLIKHDANGRPMFDPATGKPVFNKDASAVLGPYVGHLYDPSEEGGLQAHGVGLSGGMMQNLPRVGLSNAQKTMRAELSKNAQILSNANMASVANAMGAGTKGSVLLERNAVKATPDMSNPIEAFWDNLQEVKRAALNAQAGGLAASMGAQHLENYKQALREGRANPDNMAEWVEHYKGGAKGAEPTAKPQEHASTGGGAVQPAQVESASKLFQQGSPEQQAKIVESLKARVAKGQLTKEQAEAIGGKGVIP